MTSEQRDVFRAVLEGAGYENLDRLLATGDVALGRSIGETARTRTLELIAAREQAERERDEARAEVERYRDGEKQAHQTIARISANFREADNYMRADRDKWRAAAAHWQAEHGRLRARIADTAYAITFQTLGQYRSALLASSTPAPTGDGPQAGGGETPCVVCRRAPCVCCREYISMCQHGEVVGHCEACKTPVSGEGEGNGRR